MKQYNITYSHYSNPSSHTCHKNSSINHRNKNNFFPTPHITNFNATSPTTSKFDNDNTNDLWHHRLRSPTLNRQPPSKKVDILGGFSGSFHGDISDCVGVPTASLSPETFPILAALCRARPGEMTRSIFRRRFIPAITIVRGVFPRGFSASFPPAANVFAGFCAPRLGAALWFMASSGQFVCGRFCDLS